MRRKRAKKLLAAKKPRKRARRATAKKGTPVMETKPVYVAPKRTAIKEAVCALLPHVDPKLIKRLDYWALYTIHQDVVRDAKDAEALARKLIRGYEPGSGKGTVQPPAAVGGAPAALTEKEIQRMRKAEELEQRKEEARNKELSGKERARAARMKARAAMQAARVKERAARAAARAKQLASKYRSKASKPSAPAAVAPAAPAGSAAKAAPARRAGGAYIPPTREHIRDELAKLMPMIKRSDLTGLDYWALYTMHSRICKYGDDPESMARKFVRGYTRAKR